MGPYPMELRERVLKARDSGESQEYVARRFDVSVRWIQKLEKRRRETGSIEPKPNLGRRPIVTGPIEVRLQEAVADSPDATLEELRDQCEIPGSIMCVFRALNRLNITFKKSL